jgi:hypothetical protein
VYHHGVASERDRERRLLRLYGITLDDYARLLAAQGGVCAICKKPPAEGSNLAVDHDHAIVTRVPKAKRTPELLRSSVRGLLCWLCNHRRIGRGATPAIMHAAGDYLEGALAKTQSVLS